MATGCHEREIREHLAKDTWNIANLARHGQDAWTNSRKVLLTISLKRCSSTSSDLTRSCQNFWCFPWRSQNWKRTTTECGVNMRNRRLPNRRIVRQQQNTGGFPMRYVCINCHWHGYGYLLFLPLWRFSSWPRLANAIHCCTIVVWVPDKVDKAEVVLTSDWAHGRRCQTLFGNGSKCSSDSQNQLEGNSEASRWKSLDKSLDTFIECMKHHEKSRNNDQYVFSPKRVKIQRITMTSPNPVSKGLQRQDLRRRIHSWLETLKLTALVATVMIWLWLLWRPMETYGDLWSLVLLQFIHPFPESTEIHHIQPPVRMKRTNMLRPPLGA